ncbi:filamentous hemagglutinin N-terminal domain-containing protein [Leclercia adecarboxylata]|uniref:filamentous hemagglutinin N-terminal domain-containing protein n=1 Tax=Leclercia TaxID=83654 RepID=UPI001BDC056D|nr:MULTISPECIES: filamentous hemagglutinin N-terminal domain-containing protein [Leclercia]MCZ7837729.1 filamentous hemagglutinin N-terminal domain-containing protein [Leclercia adecarboxylata]QVV59280.1 filamentous hemagglutinin N-terminal domain-containing protein [Leclercia sp. Colony189]
MFKMKIIYVALAAALSSSVVMAEPNTYKLGNGPKVIDIEKPNKAGVSHNIYNEFNVDSKGVIFNNNLADATHSKYGDIAKNSNLDGAAASVILNEVVSNKASLLAGFMEVSGQKADVIVANPNGITCSGCSFINTNKAILTTGKVNLAENGAIGSYDVTKGNVTINGNGMYAENSYVMLLADAIKLTGTLDASNAYLSAGNFTMDGKTDVVTSHRKQATEDQLNNPVYSIDIANFGGVRANSITMMGNNLGFGVRNKGTIVANTSLAMASNGALVNEGTINSNGFATQVVSAGVLQNTGNISTKNNTLIRGMNHLLNSGNITSTKQLILSNYGSVENKGNIKGQEGLELTAYGNLITHYGSTLSSNGNTNINVLNNVLNGGSISGQNVRVNFSGSAMQITGNLYGYDNVIIQSVNQAQDAISNGSIINEGQLLSKGDLIVQTNGMFGQTATANTEVWNKFTANVNNLTNLGDITAPSIEINNQTLKNAGTLYANDITLNSGQELWNEGSIHALKNMTLNTKNARFTNRGTIRADDTLNITANKVENGGYRCGLFNLKTCDKGTLSASRLVLTSSHNSDSEMGGTQHFNSVEIKRAQ